MVADGGTVHLRPLIPGDAEALVAFHAGLSMRTRYLRYFSAYPTIPQRDLIRFTHVDHVDRVALAAWLGREIVAVGRFDRLPGPDPGMPGTAAEVAFVVADAHQGRGIGSVLLEHLAETARELGIARFEALVLGENTTMIRVFLDAGYQLTRHREGNEVSLEFDIAATEQTEKVMRERELRAESRSIRRLLAPRSVAVIGASADPAKVGNLVVRNLQGSGFTGPIFPVNPQARSVNATLAYPGIAEVPGEVDLAVLAIPAADVGEVVSQCAARGVHGLVVMSAGFGESGTAEARLQGARAQRELVSRARAHGMRVVGPNCLGVINTDPAVALNASRPRSRRWPGGPVSSASPGHWGSRCWARRPGADWVCRASSRPATGPTCQAMTCSSTGRATREPRSPCCTWKASATLASSPGLPAGSRGTSPSWPSRAAAARW